VKNVIGRPYLMDGTITRKMRKLKNEGRIVYHLADKSRSIYTKTRQLNIFQV